MRLFSFDNCPSVVSCASVAGGTEQQGPLSSFFDITENDTKFGLDTWEKAESRMIELCISLSLKKAGLSAQEIDLAFAGDLMNQCTASNFAFRGRDLPFCGLYGACSTFAESLGLAALAVDSGKADRTLSLASSHFCTAERQYRYPLEYGNQRTPASQTTVTGAGCVILGRGGPDAVCISEFLPGRIVDLSAKDMNNMGAAMAPAALDTLLRYQKETCTDFSRFDGIFTGDLGAEGLKMLRILAEEKGLSLPSSLGDCGLLIYDRARQDVHAGGSGAGCSASVFCGYLYSKLQTGEWNDILLIGTGALMSPATALQKETIPAIAHLVRIRRL